MQFYFPTGQVFFHPPEILTMGNYSFENLNSFFHQINEIILNQLKNYSQTYSNDHLCNTTNSEFTQANSRKIVTV